MPRANTVSRYLGERNQVRAQVDGKRLEGFTVHVPGFRCLNLEDGSVRVEYVVSRRDGSDVKRRQDRAKALERYTEILSRKFTVTRRTESGWTYLVVE